MSLFNLVSAAILAAGLVSAQFSSLSDSCNNALTGLAADQDVASCLSFSSLAPLLIANENTSLIEPIDGWLESFCAAPVCSNSTIEEAVNNITSGCSAELSVLGYSSDMDVTSIVQQAFPTVKRVLCLEDSDTKCVTQSLTDVQDAVGVTLTVNNIVSLVSGSLAGSNTTSIPTNVTCSNCAKAAYNIVNEDYPDLLSGADSDVQEQCGADFVDGQTPSGVSETASLTAQDEADNSDDGAFVTRANLMISVLMTFVGGMVYLA